MQKQPYSVTNVVDNQFAEQIAKELKLGRYAAAK